MSHASRFVSLGFLSVLCAACAMCASAQEGVESAPQGGALAPAETERVEISQEIEGAGDEFARLSAETALARARLELIEAQRLVDEAEARLQGGGAVAQAPILIGIFGAGEVRLAELALGRTTRRLRVGDQVTHEYRLAEIGLGSAVLVNERGERSRLFINRRSAPLPVLQREYPAGAGSQEQQGRGGAVPPVMPGSF